MDETKHVHRMRDLPILDVSQALLSGNNKHEVISAVVTNMTAYVKHCHGGPFDAHVVEGASLRFGACRLSLQIRTALSTFLARFSRSVTDWRWDEIDLCALLDVASAAVKTTVPTPSVRSPPKLSCAERPAYDLPTGANWFDRPFPPRQHGSLSLLERLAFDTPIISWRYIATTQKRQRLSSAQPRSHRLNLPLLPRRWSRWTTSAADHHDCTTRGAHVCL